MSRGADFDVIGGEELERQFERLPKRVRDTISGTALRKGGKVVVKAARDNLRGRPFSKNDRLSKSIGTKLGRDKITLQVGARRKIGKGGRHAHLVEFGHGGPKAAPPHPFLEPAVQEKKQSVFNAIKHELEAFFKVMK